METESASNLFGTALCLGAFCGQTRGIMRQPLVFSGSAGHGDAGMKRSLGPRDDVSPQLSCRFRFSRWAALTHLVLVLAIVIEHRPQSSRVVFASSPILASPTSCSCS